MLSRTDAQIKMLISEWWQEQKNVHSASLPSCGCRISPVVTQVSSKFSVKVRKCKHPMFKHFLLETTVLDALRFIKSQARTILKQTLNLGIIYFTFLFLLITGLDFFTLHKVQSDSYSEKSFYLVEGVFPATWMFWKLSSRKYSTVTK